MSKAGLQIQNPLYAALCDIKNEQMPNLARQYADISQALIDLQCRLTALEDYIRQRNGWHAGVKP